MSCEKIVCPFDRGIVERFRGREIAVRIDDPLLAPAARDLVRETRNSLMCVLCESPLPLAATPLPPVWDGIPLGLSVPGAGRMRDLAPITPRLRELDLRVFLPYSRENLTGLRVLSSIGIPCGLVLEEGEPDWEALADLMTYAVLEGVPHAPIEPFDLLRRNYDPERFMQWGAGFFDDPTQFVHLDREGRAALSPRDLRQGRFVGTVDGLEGSVAAALTERARARRSLFVEDHPCAACAGFRLCLGRFDRPDKGGPGAPGRAGCSGFFSEMMDALDLHREQKAQRDKAPAWQL